MFDRFERQCLGAGRKVLEEIRDELSEEIVEDEKDLENRIKRMTERERNKYALERVRAKKQRNIDSDKVDLAFVDALIANKKAEEDATAPA